VIWTKAMERRRRRRLSTHRGHHPHLILKGFLATTAAAGLTLAGLTSAQPSMAATPGAGLMASAFHGFLGNEITPTGARGYCPDPDRAAPFGSTDDGASIDSFTSDTGHTWTGDDLRKINYVLLHYGDTDDDTQAAAVNAYIYAFTGSNLGGGIAVGSKDEGAAYIDSSFGSVTDKYNEIWDDAEANWGGSASSPGSGNLNFTTDANNFSGTVTAAVTPANATGTVTLSNGIFTSTASATMSGVAAGETLAIAGKPLSDKDTSYRIGATGTFGAPIDPTADSNVMMFTTGSEQRLLSAGTSSTPNASFAVSGSDSADRSTLFAPVVSTSAVSRFVAIGEHPQDALTFSTAPFAGSDGRTVNNPWKQSSSGEYAVIKSSGVLYGPSNTPFSASATAPSNTRVAGHATVSTDPRSGPGVLYTVTSDAAVTSAGYYTWVWSITDVDQAPEVASFLPLNYSFADAFGQASETQVAPGQLKFETQLSTAQSGLGETVTDKISPVPDETAWLKIGTANVPITLTGTVYFSTDKPIQSASAPKTATVIGTLSQVLTVDQPVTSQSIPVGSSVGYITVQWSVRKDEQPAEFQGLIADWSDDYGVPTETVEVRPPTVVTAAQPNSAPGGTVQDIATVSGPIPAGGLDIAFAGYLQPSSSSAPVCDATNQTFASSSPLFANAAGDYASQLFDVPASTRGTIFWIETASIHGTHTIVHVGTCGHPGESTEIAHPTIVTTPPTRMHEGSAARDLASVSGWVNDGMSITFRLYKRADGAASLECNDLTQVGSQLGPVPLSSGLAINVDYQSPESESLQPGDYGFIEQLVDTSGTVVSVGGCHDELFTVSSAPTGLALTGLSPVATGLGAGGLMAGGALAGLVLLLLRRARSKNFV
jgi:hypothetical protein